MNASSLLRWTEGYQASDTQIGWWYGTWASAQKLGHIPKNCQWWTSIMFRTSFGFWCFPWFSEQSIFRKHHVEPLVPSPELVENLQGSQCFPGRCSQKHHLPLLQDKTAHVSGVDWGMWNVLYLFLNHKQFEELGRSWQIIGTAGALQTQFNGLCSQIFKGKSTGNHGFICKHAVFLETSTQKIWNPCDWKNDMLGDGEWTGQLPALPENHRCHPGQNQDFAHPGDGTDRSGESSHLTSAPLN